MSWKCKWFGHRMSREPREVVSNFGTYMAYCCERKAKDGTGACFYRVPVSLRDAVVKAYQNELVTQVMSHVR